MKSASPLRILHVITTLDVGGAEMHLLSQVRGQVARGHTVEVAYLKGLATLSEDFRRAGAAWVGSLATGLSTPFFLGRKLRDFDVVHSHLLKADVLTAIVATLAGRRRRLVSSKHNDEHVLKRLPVSLVHGVTGNLPARTIVLSDHVGRFFQRYGRVRASRLVRIYYGIDPAPFEAAVEAPPAQREAARAELGLAAEDVVFTCVARFARQKAHDVLLEAFDRARAALGEQGPRVRLLLVGDDPFGDGRQRAQAHAQRLGLVGQGPSDPVLFAGIRRDVPRLLAASDVFVMSSLWEGLGLVFLEAMACRLPVLSTRVSAIPEVVLEERTGLLVAPSDPCALGAAMVRLARQDELRESLGEEGYRRVREVFTLDRMVEQTLAVYRSLGASSKN